MKSFDEILEPIKTALLSVSENVGLFEPIDATKTHIVYAPDSESNELPLDNAKTGQVIQGTIDLYATRADRTMAGSIQAALVESNISFSLNSVQFEDLENNDFIHYEWVFEVA